jgi:transposase
MSFASTWPKLMATRPLGGHVEADETMVGVVAREASVGAGLRARLSFSEMAERRGDIITRIVPDVRRATLEPHILENVVIGATISTDELRSYADLARHGYKHGAVNHGSEQWVDRIHHVNSPEGFWSLLKRTFRGTHAHVSAKHLAKYLGEYGFRWNRRHAPQMMLSRLLASFWKQAVRREPSRLAGG